MDETNPSTGATRAYDSSGRRRAAEQRHRHVATVAAELFATHGWTGTTIAGVAKSAGVSPEPVARTFGGRPGLLMTAFGQVSFDQDVNTRELLAGLHLDEEPDRDVRLEAIVDLSCRALEPTALLIPVLLHAAAQDDTVNAPDTTTGRPPTTSSHYWRGGTTRRWLPDRSGARDPAGTDVDDQVSTTCRPRR